MADILLSPKHKQRKAWLLGINGAYIYSHIEAFEKVWPELRTSYNEIKLAANRSSCPNCVIDKMASRLLDEVLSMPGRDLEPLGTLDGLADPVTAKQLLAGAEVSDEQILTPMLALVKQPTEIQEKTDLFWSKLDLLIEVFPEKAGDLQEAYLSVVAGKCKSTIAAFKLMSELASLCTDGRDISKVADVITSAPKTLTNPKPTPITGGFRKNCLNCTRKHLAQAIVLIGESLQGYPQHRWLAVGHLAEAAEECITINPGLAAQIREERLKLMEDKDYLPDLMSFFDD